MPSHERKHEERLHRQFDAIGRSAPVSKGFIQAIRGNRYRYVRVPLGILLIIGGFLAILPVFGLWMLPVGLMLLAVDIPVMRPRVSAALIRLRRRIGVWRHKKKSARAMARRP